MDGSISDQPGLDTHRADAARSDNPQAATPPGASPDAVPGANGAQAATTASPKRLDSVDIGRIMETIPHRYPFLLIDRVVDVELDHAATGVKNVTINEPFFQGHFPQRPVMPGVLIIEAMAQTAAVLVVLTLGSAFEGRLVYFMTVEHAKFRRPVVPGDQLRIHVTKDRHRGNVWKFHAVAKVDGVNVAEAGYSAMILDADR